MEEYIRFMNHKNMVRSIKLLAACALLVVLLCTVAYLNTRFNGFADVHPAAYYFQKVRQFLESVCEMLANNPRRFINFFNESIASRA